MFPEHDDYHLTFELRERQHRTLFTDQMAVHILELTKFNKALGELATERRAHIQRLLRLLRQKAELPEQLKTLSLADLESLELQLEDQLEAKLANDS